MSTQTPEIRHPLGLPPGSVRALLAVMITGLFVTLIMMPADASINVPMFLYPLMSLLLIFATAHGRTIGGQGHRQPFGLPRGSILVLITLGIAAAIAYQVVYNRELLVQRLTPTKDQLMQWPELLGALFGGFLFGRIVRLGPWRDSPMYQDLIAWVSLLCMIGLSIETLALVFIHPTLPEGLNLKALEVFLTAAVALYFGARS